MKRNNLPLIFMKHAENTSELTEKLQQFQSQEIFPAATCILLILQGEQDTKLNNNANFSPADKRDGSMCSTIFQTGHQKILQCFFENEITPPTFSNKAIVTLAVVPSSFYLLEGKEQYGLKMEAAAAGCRGQIEENTKKARLTLLLDSLSTCLKKNQYLFVPGASQHSKVKRIC